MTIKISDIETGEETIWTISEKSLAYAAIAIVVWTLALLLAL